MKHLILWIDKRFPLISTWRRYFSEYKVPRNLNIFYIFGALALVVLIIQLISGLFLTMFYTPTVEQAFNSIQFIMRDIHSGWLIRYMHTTGASAFFIVLYFHIFRGLLYGSYKSPRELVWLLGMALFFLVIAEAFFGYLLPWGQLSFWGAQVITSLVGVFPFIGDQLVVWLRGDYSVGDATLHRFYALHVVAIPVSILVLVFLHIVALHSVGSNNPEGFDAPVMGDESHDLKSTLPFYPYFVINDLVGIIAFLIIFFSIVFFVPEAGGLFIEAENYTPANSLITPESITPMWYLSPYYAILRAVPGKFMGIVMMSASLLLLILLPWLDRSPVRSMRYKGIYSQIALGLLVISFFALMGLGRMEITHNNLFLSRFFIILYFSYFIFMPVYTKHEVIRLRRVNGKT